MASDVGDGVRGVKGRCFISRFHALRQSAAVSPMLAPTPRTRALVRTRCARRRTLLFLFIDLLTARYSSKASDALLAEGPEHAKAHAAALRENRAFDEENFGRQ